MTKAYLVSEELLRQVLEGLKYGAMRIPTGATGYAEAYGAIEALRTILAKEPSEPVAWLFKDLTWTPIKAMGVDHNGMPVFVKDSA
jgi:hypothetical protein